LGPRRVRHSGSVAVRQVSCEWHDRSGGLPTCCETGAHVSSFRARARAQQDAACRQATRETRTAAGSAKLRLCRAGGGRRRRSYYHERNRSMVLDQVQGIGLAGDNSVQWRVSTKLRKWAQRIGRNWVLHNRVYFCACHAHRIVIHAARSPLRRFVRQDYGLSNQTHAEMGTDSLTELALTGWLGGLFVGAVSGCCARARGDGGVHCRRRPPFIVVAISSRTSGSRRS